MTMWTDVAGLEYRQCYYQAGPIRTRVIEAGSGAPFLFLHGTGGHAESFLRNLSSHAKHFRVLLIDMVGHGYSDAPDVEYSMDTLIQHLADFVDALGYDKVMIGGGSLGGMVAAWYAIRYPHRVKKLSLVTALLMNRDEQGKAQLRDAHERSHRTTEEVSRAAVQSRLGWLMHEPSKSVTDELVEVRYRIYKQEGRAAIIRRISDLAFGGVVDDSWAAKWSSPEHMRGIQCPTLLVWSRFNPGLTAERAAQGMAYIPNARMTILEDSAHWPQWEEPAAFDSVHIPFLLQP